MVLGYPRGHRSSCQVITFSLERGSRQSHHPAGEHTRERADDAECSVWNAGDAAGGVRCRWVRDGVPMTAHSPSPVAESASSTIDPDAQARRTNDGELSAEFQSDLTIDEDAVDGLLNAEEFPAELDDSTHKGKLYAEYRRLAAEQASLRRLEIGRASCRERV